MNKVVDHQHGANVTRLTVGSELLNGQFLIQAPLQHGGFGITYVARDSLARQVVVKECYPTDIVGRKSGLVHALSTLDEKKFAAIKAQFIREARQMAKLVHPNIVAVHQVFEENNTAYMALDKVKGDDLVTVAEDQPERITNGFLTTALQQCLTALAFIHDNGLLHRDVSPDNIMVDTADHLTLIDFGAAKEQSKESISSVFAVKDGYSPYEFYLPNGVHTFSSDLYALAATFYYLITGQPPVNSYTRLRALTGGEADPYTPLVTGDWKCDYNLLATIDRALKMHQKNRFQSASDWLSDLQATPSHRPVRRSKPMFDPDLENEIAQIVHTTNAQLETGAARVAKQVKAAAAQNAQKQTIVDIFGHPIDDIDAWQDEQEREIQNRVEKDAKTNTGANLWALKHKILSDLTSRYRPKLKTPNKPTSRGDTR
ncbi:MAG: serine/threonine protein kinase [Roseobacter sp.]